VKQLSSATGGDAIPAEEKNKRGIPTGIVAYDRRSYGLHQGQKTTIVAHPGVGKTALSLQIAVNVAIQNIAVLFFVSEMSRDELADRQLAQLARIDGDRLKEAMTTPCLTTEEWARLYEALEIMKTAPLFIVDESELTIDDIVMRTKSFAETSLIAHGAPLGLIVIDGIQRLEPPTWMERANPEAQVKYATRKFTKLLKGMNIPGIEGAQQKNADRDNPIAKKPVQGRAAESFWIEREAANVIYLWRPDPKKKERITFVITKQRGTKSEIEIPMHFDGATQRFLDPDMTAASRDFVEGSGTQNERWWER
jgi:replicative DNA helicase